MEFITEIIVIISACLCVVQSIFHGHSLNSLSNTTFTLTTHASILKDALLTTPELIQRYGYRPQTHYVKTSDGYILGLHRILGRATTKLPTKRKKVALLWHGLISSSSDFVFMGPNQGLGYYLSDLGYDVWLGNSRGNRYSRRNIRLSPKNREFWNFSYHQIGTIDLPETIDYILAKTREKNLMYVGFSQGNTQLFVMASERPEYVSKINHAHAMSPVAFLKHQTSPIFRTVSTVLARLDASAPGLGAFEVFNNSPIIKLAANVFCKRTKLPELCNSILFLIAGFDTNQINQTQLPVIFSHIPAGASSMQFAHFGQVIHSDRFAKYDHGSLNLLHYGKTLPPLYNLTRMTIPIALHYADNDSILRPRDAFRLNQFFPNIIGWFRVHNPKFNHYDFILGADTRELVYKRIADIARVYTYS